MGSSLASIMIRSLFQVIAVISIVFCFIPPTSASTFKNPRIEKLFTQYYAAYHAGNKKIMRITLHKILDIDPKNVRALRALGYSYSANGESAKSAVVFSKALKLSGHNPRLELQTGYAYSSAEEKSKAEKFFEYAMETKSKNIYEKACLASIYDGYFNRHFLPIPWYITFYTDDFYESRINDVIFPVKIRLGRYLDKARKVSLYTYFHFNDDLRSHGGLLPEIYNDNYAGIGFGVDWFPLNNHSLRLFAETGEDYSLLNYKKPLWRNSTTAGAEFYKSWGASRSCSLRAEWPLRYFGDIYASMAYYTRYNDAIGQVVMRQGIRLLNYHMNSISAYFKVNLVSDTRDIFYNNVVEYGPGISWRPDERFPLSLRAEYLFGNYIRGVDYTRKKDTYSTFMLQAIIYLQ